ncbi:MAG: carbon-nitrogen hydrolase family protein [Chitinophagaceae bacterium]|nr:carbon-nitrogen hydrolase family protein [Chitinophagaceae bacterium]
MSLNKRLPREIWVAGISLKGLWPAATIEKRMNDVVERISNVLSFQPDIICLPETVNISWVNEEILLHEIAEEEHSPGPITRILGKIAKENNCYITCPIITKKDGAFYNSSILLNRRGESEGVFHKIHPTSTEIIPGKYFKNAGVVPGPINSNVFKTDFGNVGLQVCADADWADGWAALKANGAELVCFSSQGPYSNTIRNRAWSNHYYIVTATGEDAQIVDISGDVIAADNDMMRWVCAPVNLEKTVVLAAGNADSLKSMQGKYGDSLRITVYFDENWATIESRDAEVKIKEVLDEFSMLTFEEEMRQTNELISKLRS